MCQILLKTYFPLIFQLITSSLGIPALMTNGRVLACANLLDANACTCTSGQNCKDLPLFLVIESPHVQLILSNEHWISLPLLKLKNRQRNKKLTSKTRHGIIYL